MQSTFLEYTEDMALSEENQEWILEQIQQAMYPSGWKKIANWLRYWGVFSVLATAIISLIAIAVTLGIFAVNRTNEESKFRGSTEARLTQIETSLKGLTTHCLDDGTVAASIELVDWR